MSADDFSTLFELLPIGAYRTDVHGVQVRANRAMVALFGFASEAEMLGTQTARSRGWYADPDRRAEFRGQLEAHGVLRDFVSEMRRPTGETFWISENAHMVRDDTGKVLYHEGTIEDITTRVQAEQATAAAAVLLRERTEALQLTLDNAGRGIVKVDARGFVVLYNRRFLELLDLPDALLAARPTMSEVMLFQQARGDFGPNSELLNVAPMRSVDRRAQDAAGMFDTGSYVRHTHSGLVLEVATQTLPGGGMVRTYSDVTAYFKAQKELAEKTRTLRITLDTMSQGISTIDSTGRVVMSNRRHHELLGFPEELMAGQPTMEQLVRFQIDRGDFGEDFSFVDAVARGYVAVGDKVAPLLGPETYMRQSRDGRTLEVKTLALPDGGAVRTFTDMTDYTLAQEALREKQAQLRALVNNIPDQVWLKDAAGAYLLANPAHCREHGFEEADIIGKTADEIFGVGTGPAYRRTDLLAMEAQEPVFYEDARAHPATGQLRFFELVKVAMRDEAGRSIGMLGIAHDITARKEGEAALIAARDAAEAGNRAKAEFLANMSHEIRTPMNAVIGMSDLLLDTPLSAPQREFAETIRTSGDALLVLINDILDFSKIESGHLELERVAVNLAECVESALDITGSAATAKGLELLYWIEEGVPRAMLGDMTRLRQILVNLVNNAVKFTQQGEVVVTLGRREAADGAPLLYCAVRDTGIGIPADRLGRLFQVFSQVDASTTRQFGGTGLGLAICRRLVALMGGRIWVESEPGKGSTFQFEIPCQSVPSGPVAFQSRQAASLAGRRVLLVDDNATNRQILTLQTSRWDMQPRAAASGREALAWLDAGEVFDCAIIDVQMPGMDGYMLAAELRKRMSPAQLPVLALTSLGDAGQRFAGLGLAQMLTKPTKAQVLFDALTSVFERSASASVSAPAPLAADARSPAAARRAPDTPLRLLLAEDNLVNQRVAALILNGLGYELQVVADGQLALDAVAQAVAERPFDVVLMDVQMPVMDGLEASRRLCALYPAARRPWIIAMTANAMEGDRETCLAAGMDDYLSKPIRGAAVGEALQRAVGGRAARGASS
ncbi:MAG: PAS-domain containing protein [Ramlibacter sp.]